MTHRGRDMTKCFSCKGPLKHVTKGFPIMKSRLECKCGICGPYSQKGRSAQDGYNELILMITEMALKS